MLKHEFRLLSNLQRQNTIFFITVNKSRQIGKESCLSE